jgi:hypothetical protein
MGGKRAHHPPTSVVCPLLTLYPLSELQDCGMHWWPVRAACVPAEQSGWLAADVERLLHPNGAAGVLIRYDGPHRR